MAKAAQLANWTGAFGSKGCIRSTGKKYLSLHEHLVIESVPTVEFEFKGQPMHWVPFVAPAMGENFPTEQSVHCDAACEEKAPALHVWHARRVLAPKMADALPALQSTHDVAEPSAYVPMAHS